MPGSGILAGTGQQIPLPDASVDAVFAAEAFHWLDDKQALTEIARVLRPRGAVVLMWNVPARPTEPSIAAAEEFLASQRRAQGRAARRCQAASRCTKPKM